MNEMVTKDALFRFSAAQITCGIKAREFTARAITEAFLARIEAHNPRLNAYTLVTAERALREADAVDALVTSGGDPGPLAGVPYSVKNLFDLAGEVTLAGSKINADYPPALQDATSVQRLQKAGAICLGATNMGEYAYDFVTVNGHYGATLNPHDGTRSAGGSSGGSASSVAGGLAVLSLGTDTNGSIRVPASFCGIWGLKPTYGRLSRAGGFLFAGSLDTIGVFAHTVEDLAMSLDVLDGPDARDPVCVREKLPAVGTEFEAGIAGLRIARLGGYFVEGGEPVVQEASAMVAKALGTATMLELPNPDIARAAAYTITAGEGGELHLQRLATRAADFDPGTRDRFIAGALTPAAWYLQAQRFRAWWRSELTSLFNTVDVLIAPATPLTAPLLEQETFQYAGQELPLRANIGIFTQPITLIGLPVVTVPVHLPGQLPTGVQLIGKPYSEANLLRVARMLESTGVYGSRVV